MEKGKTPPHSLYRAHGIVERLIDNLEWLEEDDLYILESDSNPIRE